jgi:hypothetical protein
MRKLKLRGKVKLYLRVIVLHHLKPSFGLGHKDQLSILIMGDVTVFGSDKLIQLLFILAADPAGFVQVHRVKFDRGIVFIF